MPRRNWVYILMCLASTLTAVVSSTISCELKGSTTHLLDKVITWADGSTEHVQIGTDGFFNLNGSERRLVGFCDPLQFTTGMYWDTANRAIINAELDYLQSVGVRIMQVDLRIAWDHDPTHYDDLIQLYYAHKMLVIPVFNVRGGGTGWDNLTTLDRVIDSNRTVTTYLTELIKHVKTHSDVVAIVLGSVMDVLGSYTYNVTQTTAFTDLMFTTARSLTRLPPIVKLGAYNTSAFALSVQRALLPYTAVACQDVYHTTPTGFASYCNAFRTYYLNIAVPKPSQMWIMGTNYTAHPELFTKAMMDAMLAANASVVMLFTTYSPGLPGSVFNSAGAPVANCQTLMANLATWQAPISQSAPTPTE